LEIDSEKVDKSIFDKRKVEKTQSIIIDNSRLRVGNRVSGYLPEKLRHIVFR